MTSDGTAQVLQVGPLKESLARRLAGDFGAAVLPADPDARARFLGERGAEVRVAVTSGRVGVGGDLMAALPRLGAVVNFGVGYDSTDIVTARRRGIAVSNTPDVLTACVADTAVALALDVMRGFSAADRFVRSGAWGAGETFPLRRRLSGARVGVLGLGRIGRAIADRLAAFGCVVAYHSRHAVAAVPYSYAPSARDLAAGCDLLVVALPGGPGTERLVDREVLDALGPRGYLVNIARGSVVDEPVLVEYLAGGRIAGAGLDVFAREPQVPERLLALDNVVLLPHLASGTHETRADMERLVLRNLESFLKDGSLVTPVT